MASRPVRDPGVAERIKMRRQARGWSIRLAADRAGMAASTWSRIERGLLSADNRFVLADIAQALECSMNELTGTPIRPVDRDIEAAQAGVRGIRQALLETDLSDANGVTPRPIAELAAETDLARVMRTRCDYAGAARLLPSLLNEVHAAAHGPDRRQALEMLVQVTHTASAVAKYMGYGAEAWIAAERGREAAEQLEDPVLIGFAAFARTHAAMACDSFNRAYILTRHAVNDLDGRRNIPGAMEVLGMLQLTAAYAARARRQTGESADWMAEAEATAQATGESNILDTNFGPTNVNLWKIAIEVDGGDPGRAVAIAGTTNPKLLNSPNRQASFYADTARALARLRNDQRAVRMLMTAETLAPQLVRSSRLVQESARSMLDRARRDAGGPQLRGICERMGLPV